jgi:hypothetical protein
MEANPALDTLKLDDEVCQSLEGIIMTLQRRFPNAHIYFHTGVEKVAEAGSVDRFHMEDRFAIVFDTKPKANQV